MEGFKKQNQHGSNPQDYIHVIEKDDSSSSWSEYDDNKEKRTCRQCVTRFLSSTKCHSCIVVAVLAVVLLMVLELCLILRDSERQRYGQLAIQVLHSVNVTVMFLFIVEILVRVAVLRVEFCR